MECPDNFMKSWNVNELCKNTDIIVTSPTFNILKTYKSDDFNLIYHYDLYRLKSIAEIEEIGLANAINTKSSICLIEWPEMIASILPKNTLYINIEHSDRLRIITANVE